MAISRRMNSRLEKIDKLIARGYKLEKTKILDRWEIPFPILTNSEGKVINTFLGGPAGFSWIAFFFCHAVYFQAKEYSYYLLAAFWWYSLANLAVGLPAIVPPEYVGIMSLFVGGLALLFSIFWASNFPYIRYLQKSRNIKDNNLFLSIILGPVFYNVAKLPWNWTLGRPSIFSELWDYIKPLLS